MVKRLMWLALMCCALFIGEAQAGPYFEKTIHESSFTMKISGSFRVAPSSSTPDDGTGDFRVKISSEDGKVTFTIDWAGNIISGASNTVSGLFADSISPRSGTELKVTSNVTLDNNSQTSRIIKIADADSDEDGDDLQIIAGKYTGETFAQDGGNLFLVGGDGNASGDDGVVVLAHTGSAARGKVGVACLPLDTSTSTFHVCGTASVSGSLEVTGALIMPDGTVTTAKLGDGAVTTSKLHSEALDPSGDLFLQRSGGSVVVFSEIEHVENNNTKLQFTADRVRIFAGGLDLGDFRETAQNYVNLGSASQDVDFFFRSSGGNMVHQGSSNKWGWNTGEAFVSSITYHFAGGDASFAGSIQAEGLTIPAGTISTADIADGAVTTLKLGDGAVTSSKMDANAVATAAIQDGAVTTSKLGPDLVLTVFSVSIDKDGSLLSPGTGARSFRAGPGALAGGIGSIAIGDVALSAGLGAISIGDAAGDSGVGINSTAIGVNSEAAGTNGVALGTNAGDAGLGNNSISIGNGSDAVGTGAIAIGQSAQAVLNNSIAIGLSAGDAGMGASAIAIGIASDATAAGSIALGGVTSSVALMFVVDATVYRFTPLATAPAACAIGDWYVDTSGAYCGCTASNTWSNFTGTGTCS